MCATGHKNALLFNMLCCVCLMLWSNTALANPTNMVQVEVVSAATTDERKIRHEHNSSDKISSRSSSSGENSLQTVNLRLTLDLTETEYHPEVNDIGEDANERISTVEREVVAEILVNSEAESVKETEEETIESGTPPCPLGFIRHKNSCYHIIGSSELTWSIANTYCQLHSSKLVEIDSESEQRFIDNMIKSAKDGQAYWIGATNRLGKGNWRWESTSEPLTSFTMWVTKWVGWVDEIEAPSCALIDTSEANQWMFWPCENNFYMTGKKHTTRTGIGLICEKESPRSPRKNRHNKPKNRKRQRRKGRRNWQNRKTKL